jgi:hypothetical protein
MPYLYSPAGLIFIALMEVIFSEVRTVVVSSSLKYVPLLLALPAEELKLIHLTGLGSQN